MAFGIDDAIGLGLGAYSAYQGQKKEKQADKLNARAMAEQQRQYDQRAPLRNLGMQALGQNEAAIDMGNIGFDANNPFARARGPVGSTAKLGGWDKMTFDAPMEKVGAEREAEMASQQQRDLLTHMSTNRDLPQKARQKAAMDLATLGAQPLAKTTYGWQR